jgi:uncharacterized membrane protein
MIRTKEVEPALEHIIEPIFQSRDIMQVIIGATILAVPVGFTEETWHLANTLPLLNIIGFAVITLFFITIFNFYHYHHYKTHKHDHHLIRRVIFTYIIAFLVVASLLTLIQQTNWSSDFVLSLKRTIIVTFPASMSAAIADTLK